MEENQTFYLIKSTIKARMKEIIMNELKIYASKAQKRIFEIIDLTLVSIVGHIQDEIRLEEYAKIVRLAALKLHLRLKKID